MNDLSINSGTPKIKRFVSQLFCFLMLLFSIHNNSYAQTLSYNIVKGGSTIGTFSISKNTSGNTTTYEAKSHSEFSVVIKSYVLDVKTTNTFIDGILTKAHTKHQLNGATRNEATTEAASGGYRTDVDGTVNIVPTSAIECTSSTLYHQEPIYVSNVYSERFGQFLQIKKVGDQKYELTQADGKKNYFTYRNGQCVEVEINHSLATIYLKKR